MPLKTFLTFRLCFAQLLLNLIAWIFAYEVTYFKGVNRLRLSLLKQNSRVHSSISRPSFLGGESGEPSTKKNVTSLVLLDRIDMIFCLQGFETALIQQFITESIHKAVKVQDLSRKARPMLRTALQCMRQLFRLLQVHVHSKKEDIVEAVRSQLSAWIGRGIVGEVAYVMRCYKPSSFEPEVFLYALEISLVYVQLVRALGGEVEVIGLGNNGLRMPRKKESRKKSSGLFGSDDEDAAGVFDTQQHAEGGGDGSTGGGWVRKVTADDVVREFMKGEIISQCIQLVG